MLEFAQRWNPLPIHTDPQVAQRGPHGGLIASGFHTMAIYQRLAVDAMGHSSPASPDAASTGCGYTGSYARAPRSGGRALITTVTQRPVRGDTLVVVDGRLTDDEQHLVFELTSEEIIARRAEAQHSSPARCAATLPATDTTSLDTSTGLYRPEPGAVPVVVYLHGGGWTIGSCHREPAPESAAIQSQGKS